MPLTPKQWADLADIPPVKAGDQIRVDGRWQTVEEVYRIANGHAIRLVGGRVVGFPDRKDYKPKGTP